jgi:hypothetical protein
VHITPAATPGVRVADQVGGGPHTVNSRMYNPPLMRSIA